MAVSQLRLLQTSSFICFFAKNIVAALVATIDKIIADFSSRRFPVI
jgi:hypothetical protein